MAQWGGMGGQGRPPLAGRGTGDARKLCQRAQDAHSCRRGGAAGARTTWNMESSDRPTLPKPLVCSGSCGLTSYGKAGGVAGCLRVLTAPAEGHARHMTAWHSRDPAPLALHRLTIQAMPAGQAAEPQPHTSPVAVSDSTSPVALLTQAK